MSLRGAFAATKQSPQRRGDCFGRKNVALAMTELLTNDLLHQLQHLPRCRMTMRFQLGIQQLLVDRHLKAPAFRWHQRYRFDHMLIILEQFICQAHGPAGVVSDRAIDNLDFQHHHSSGMQKFAPAVLDSQMSDSKLFRDYIIETTLPKMPSRFHPPVQT